MIFFAVLLLLLGILAITALAFSFCDARANALQLELEQLQRRVDDIEIRDGHREEEELRRFIPRSL